MRQLPIAITRKVYRRKPCCSIIFCWIFSSNTNLSTFIRRWSRLEGVHYSTVIKGNQILLLLTEPYTFSFIPFIHTVIRNMLRAAISRMFYGIELGVSACWRWSNPNFKPMSRKAQYVIVQYVLWYFRLIYFYWLNLMEYFCFLMLVITSVEG